MAASRSHPVRDLVLGLIKRALVGPNEPPRATSWRSDTGAVHFAAANRALSPLTQQRRVAAASARRLQVRRYWPWLAAAVVSVFFMVRMTWTSTPDGDPALHLKLIKDIASTHTLPTELPYLVARVGDDGGIEHMFPYSYTPLYHLVGAIMYSVAGVTGVLMINVAAAAAVALTICLFAMRRLPLYVASLVAIFAFVSPHVQTPFASVYMEPLMVGLLFPGAWYAYVAMSTRQPAHAAIAGLLLGLAGAVRQNGILEVCIVLALVFATMVERRRLRPSNLHRDARWMATLAGAGLLAAAPCMLYLLMSTGSLGYADLALPGMKGELAIDPVANGYIASITKSDTSIIGWLDRYTEILLYSDRWLPPWLSAFPLVLFAAGFRYMNARGGAVRFLARWALLDVVASALVFVVLHGNPRYVIVSQMLFYAVAPVGAYAIALWSWRWAQIHDRRHRVALALGVGLPLAFVSMVPIGPSFSRYLAEPDRDLRAFRGQEYAEMGAWVNANTAPDALILTPRTYTAELTWQRNVTWVTFYGNAWLVDAMTTPDPGTAYAILRAHGVDYVLIQDPPGTYIDRMPATGMRSYLNRSAADTPFFEIAHMTESAGQYGDVEHGLRLYRVQGDWEGLE
jgi:hypothetical protein